MFVEELGTMSKYNLKGISLVRGPIWGIHSLTLIIFWFKMFLLSLFTVSLSLPQLYVYMIQRNKFNFQCIHVADCRLMDRTAKISIE